MKSINCNLRPLARQMNSWIGTSGFQYPEWKGHFYPEKLPAAKMLPFYAERPSDNRNQLHLSSNPKRQND